MASSSNPNPCAACRHLNRNCTEVCEFAPYFPPNYLAKFIIVDKVFGASNVSMILKGLNRPEIRQHFVNSLISDAEIKIQNPIYRCEGPSPMLPLSQQPHLQQQLIREPQPQPQPRPQATPQQKQMLDEAQQMAAYVAGREQQDKMKRLYKEQLEQEYIKQTERMRRQNRGFDAGGASTRRLNEMRAALPSSFLGLGQPDNPIQVQQPQSQLPQESGGSNVLPSTTLAPGQVQRQQQQRSQLPQQLHQQSESGGRPKRKGKWWEQ
ncbi:hypothetical protein HHK36_030883 [Tetracentron sinense]|uniref:LOB domain-containing protein n=1 Tax=Tetracentron sinense TaxID=13715 RepID=A0A835CZ31_TETSI|nr:hypothetical protein HHK36_030883 [Tetracentron sinense]